MDSSPFSAGGAAFPSAASAAAAAAGGGGGGGGVVVHVVDDVVCHCVDSGEPFTVSLCVCDGAVGVAPRVARGSLRVEAPWGTLTVLRRGSSSVVQKHL